MIDIIGKASGKKTIFKMGMDDSLKQRIAIYTQGLRGVSICDQQN